MIFNLHYSDEKTEACRGNKRLVQGHLASKWPWQDSNPSSLAPELKLSITTPHCPQMKRGSVTEVEGRVQSFPGTLCTLFTIHFLSSGDNACFQNSDFVETSSTWGDAVLSLQM